MIKDVETFNEKTTEHIVLLKSGKIKSTHRMFSGSKNLQTIEFKKEFDTSKVTDMIGMFSECINLTSIKGLEYFNTQSVTKMSEMFHNCERLTELDLSSFTGEKVEDIRSMISFCPSLRKINLEKFDIREKVLHGGFIISCDNLKEITVNPSNTNVIKKIVTENGFNNTLMSNVFKKS